MIQIDKNIPIPLCKRGGARRTNKLAEYLLANMKPGDSAKFPTHNSAMRIRQYIEKRLGLDSVIYRKEGTGVRLWRSK